MKGKSEQYQIDMVIYTIGTSNRNLEEFIDILKTYEISILLDVRSFPESSRFPWFNKEHLASALIEHKINYIFLGPELGGYRKGGYEAYIKTEDFKKGLDKIEKIVSSNRSVIMCAEKLPERCHRWFIAESLQDRGFKVFHIIDKDKTFSFYIFNNY
ncbi:MAG: DUF488 family protein [bacterium]